MMNKEKAAQEEEEREDENKHFNLNRGLTPPLKKVQKRKFWRELKKKYQ